MLKIKVACNNISSWPDPKKGRLMELPFIGQIIQVTIPKYSKIIPNTDKSSNEAERKENIKRASSSNPREKDLKDQQISPINPDEIEEKIQTQNYEILQHKKSNSHHKEKPEGRKTNQQPSHNLSFLLRHGDNKEKGTFQDINFVKCLGGSKLGYLWKLWELVLTNQPLLIVSDSPTKCRSDYY